MLPHDVRRMLYCCVFRYLACHTHHVSWQVANIRYMFYDTTMFDQPETDEHFARTNPHYEYYDRYGRTAAHAEPDLRGTLSSPVD